MPPWRISRTGDVGVPRTPDALAREGYDRHGGELYRYALGRLSDDAAAQDAVQETIVRAWRSAGHFDPAKAALRSWLFAILRNVVNDHMFARQRAAALPALAADGTEGHMSDQTDAVIDTDLVTWALGHISLDHRTAIVETYLRDRPYVDVAEDLGISVSTLRSRVFHGLRHLRRAMSTMATEP
ncbi:MAG: sigma-70 family RNA polymerase sigma factor [Aeromicrobium sp.]